MEYFIGAILALGTNSMASLVRFDRDRNFYPVVVIVIASYYSLFAAMGGSSEALLLDSAIAVVFTLVAIIGFRTNSWLIVAALAGHGALDLVHHQIVSNAGVPEWWPGFCMIFDLTAALYLAASLVMRSHKAPAPYLK